MKRPLVAISVGNAEEQLELGFGEDHLAEALVRLSRLLLRDGCDLVYGGDLRPQGFTRLLLDLVLDETGDLEVGGKTRRSDELRRLVNYLAWPNHLELTADQKARYLGACRFVCVDPPLPLPSGDPALPVAPDEGLLRAPLALTRMRRAMAAGGLQDIDSKPVAAAAARVVLGGKMSDFKGLLPGILEEVAWAVIAGRGPVFVLGGFGGAAAALARSVLAGELLPELAPDAVRQRSRWSAGAVSVLGREPFATQFEDLLPQRCEQALAQFCKEGVEGLAARCRLRPAAVEVLLRSPDFDAVRAVLATVRWGELGRGGRRGTSPPRPAKSAVAPGTHHGAGGKSRRTK